MPHPRARRAEKRCPMKFRSECDQVVFHRTGAWNPGKSASAFCQNNTCPNAAAPHCTRESTRQRRSAIAREFDKCACGTQCCKTHLSSCDENVHRCHWSVVNRPWFSSDRCSRQPNIVGIRDVLCCHST